MTAAVGVLVAGFLAVVGGVVAVSFALWDDWTLAGGIGAVLVGLALVYVGLFADFTPESSQEAR